MSEPRRSIPPALSDTSPEAERIVVEACRRMTPAEKLRRVCSLNRSLEVLALARIRSRFGRNLSEREVRLRLAALRLDRALMIAAFGWDPVREGW